MLIKQEREQHSSQSLKENARARATEPFIMFIKASQRSTSAIVYAGIAFAYECALHVCVRARVDVSLSVLFFAGALVRSLLSCPGVPS